MSPFRSLTLLLSLAGLAGLTSPIQAQEDGKVLALQVQKFLEATCYRCHGKDGNAEGGFDYVLDVKKMIERRKVVPNDPKKSRIHKRIVTDEMPLEGEKPRPTKADVDLLERWINAGAPEFPPPPAAARPFLTEKDTYKAIYDHLFTLYREEAKYQRYITFTHLHNNPRVSDAELRLYRAGVAKLLNSLSWRRALVFPKPIDKHETILAVDLRDLDWDINDGWIKLIGHTADEPSDEFHPGYPYALTHELNPDDADLKRLAQQVYLLTSTRVPAVRGDWFLATASLPPLYHELLNLPRHAGELEKQLRVNVAYNMRRDRVARAGFATSGVSAQANRLIERHDAAYGAYWKSYDFRSNEGAGNLFQFPLGPRFPGNPYNEQAFVHAGGEIIFNLPNGLQAYLLVDDKDNRINAGPADVVRDKNETAGKSTLILNGLSCMACHKHGMITDFKESVRRGAGVQGDALDKVKRLFPEDKEMQRLMKIDEDLFLETLDRVVSPYVRGKGNKKLDVKEFVEPISLLATPFLRGNVSLEEAALELGLADPKELQFAIKNNARLRDELGLKPWLNGDTIKRESWQSVRGLTSPFQETAAELQRGASYRIRR
jgi:Planctomycete cytochrome C